MNAVILMAALGMGQAGTQGGATAGNMSLDGTWSVVSIEVNGRQMSGTHTGTGAGSGSGTGSNSGSGSTSGTGSGTAGGTGAGGSGAGGMGSTVTIRNNTLTLPGVAALPGMLRLEVGPRFTVRVTPASGDANGAGSSGASGASGSGSGSGSSSGSGRTGTGSGAGGTSGTTGSEAAALSSGVCVHTHDFLCIALGDNSMAGGSGAASGSSGSSSGTGSGSSSGGTGSGRSGAGAGSGTGDAGHAQTSVVVILRRQGAAGTGTRSGGSDR